MGVWPPCKVQVPSSPFHSAKPKMISSSQEESKNPSLATITCRTMVYLDPSNHTVQHALYIVAIILYRMYFDSRMYV